VTAEQLGAKFGLECCIMQGCATYCYAPANHFKEVLLVAKLLHCIHSCRLMLLLLGLMPPRWRKTKYRRLGPAASASSLPMVCPRTAKSTKLRLRPRSYPGSLFSPNCYPPGSGLGPGLHGNSACLLRPSVLRTAEGVILLLLQEIWCPARYPMSGPTLPRCKVSDLCAANGVHKRP
jgi:hypothetical protein